MRIALYAGLVVLLTGCAQPSRVVTVPEKDSDEESSDSKRPLPNDPFNQPSEPIQTETETASSATSTGSSPLEGVWLSPCRSGDGTTSYRTIYTFIGAGGTNDRTFFSDAACSTATHRIVFAYGTFKLGQMFKAADSAGVDVEAYEVDKTFESVTLTILSQDKLDEVVDDNDDYYYPDDDLKLNTPFDITGRNSGTSTQPAKGSTEYSSIRYNATEMYPSVTAGASVAERGLVISTNRYLKQK
ncbi:MAG: hypothetical protein AB7T49_15345 [Oligoflexales bacterium]